MFAPLQIWLPDALKTRFAGASLASSLYRFPVDILLSGPLGAGKTAFVQGLAEGLGIHEPLASPTYALEQRYVSQNGLSFIHLDLYRMKESQTAQLLHSSDDHTGIRCIEWAERAPHEELSHPSIIINLQEEGNGRMLAIDFQDIPLPGKDDIEQWFKECKTPEHIIQHCRAVSAFAAKVASYLLLQGTIVRATAVEKAGLLHDLLRFIDFKNGASPKNFNGSPEDVFHWESMKQRYINMHHEEACAAFLTERGFNELAHIVEAHGLQNPPSSSATIEQKVLYYADKRVTNDTVVSVQERFDEFQRRYGNGMESDEFLRWQQETLNIEHGLFPDGPPI